MNKEPTAEEVEVELELARARARAKAAKPPPPPPAAETGAGPQLQPEDGGPSTSTAAILGAVRGASAGFGDELRGAERALKGGAMSVGLGLAQTELGRRLLGGSLVDKTLPSLAQWAGLEDRGSIGETLGATYRRGRDETRALEEAAYRAHPGIAAASELAGALAVPLPSPGKGVAIGRTGAALTKAGERAIAGAIQGGAMGAGSSTGDLTQGELGQVAGDVIQGAGMGAGLGVGLGALGERASQALRNWSEANAVRALGLKAGITDRLRKMGFGSAQDAQRELGKRALDEGLVRIGSTPSSILRDAQELLPYIGAAKGQVIQDAQAAAAAAGKQVDFNAAADAALKAALDGADTIAIAKGGQARRLAELVRQQGTTATMDDSLVLLDKLKQSAQDSIRPMAPQLAQQQVNRVAGALRDETERQVEALAGPELADALRAANSKYRFLKQVEELTGRASTQDLGNKGALGMVLGATMGSSGGVLGGLGGAGAGQFFQRHIAPAIPATKAVLERAASRLVPSLSSPAARMATAGAATGDEPDPVGAALEWMRQRYGEAPQSKSELGASAYVRGQGGSQ